MDPFRSTIVALRRRYGKPPVPVSRDPFQLILWEHVAYLAPDPQRRLAFETLRDQVGLAPAKILAASPKKLEAIARIGGKIAPALRAQRMLESAGRVLDEWDGDLSAALELPLPKARRALMKFAMIGEPGADKILVIAKKARLVPLDSNALRVLARLGFITETKNYSATYRRAQEVLAPSLPANHDWLEAAGALLRRHGQETCLRSNPACARCALYRSCPSSSVALTPRKSPAH